MFLKAMLGMMGYGPVTAQISLMAARVLILCMVALETISSMAVPEMTVWKGTMGMTELVVETGMIVFEVGMETMSCLEGQAMTRSTDRAAMIWWMERMAMITSLAMREMTLFAAAMEMILFVGRKGTISFMAREEPAEFRATMGMIFSWEERAVIR
jgi:hypothetical protein